MNNGSHLSDRTNEFESEYIKARPGRLHGAWEVSFLSGDVSEDDFSQYLAVFLGKVTLS